MAQVRTTTDMDLKDLSSLSQRLKVATDELNVALQAIQDKLNALGIGVEVWLDNTKHWLGDPIVTSRSELGDGKGTLHRSLRIHELGYARLADGWALVTRDREYDEVGFLDDNGNVRAWELCEAVHPPGDPKPLLRASRAVRMHAVKQIPQLIAAIHDSANEVVKAVEQARQIAESLE